MIRKLFLALLLAFAGCRGTDPEPRLDLSGDWGGPDGQGGTVAFALVHDLETDTLSGAWTSTNGQVVVKGTLTGSVKPDTRAVSVSMSYEGSVVFAYNATVSTDGESMEGVLRETTGDTHPLSLARKQG